MISIRLNRGRHKLVSEPIVCKNPPFPPFFTRLLWPDVGVQEQDATIDDDSYYTGGAYYYMQAADGDQE